MKQLERLASVIELINDRVGKTVAWLALVMVLVQFVVVVMRYVFGLGSVMMQESIVYMHAVIFLAASGFTLLHGGHVRCDIFYADAPPRRKAIIDLFGVVAFLIPTCLTIAWVAWPYVAKSWEVQEASPEGSLGIPAVYLLKTFILVFAGLVLLQGIALALRSLFVLSGRPSGDGGAGGAPDGAGSE